MAIEDYAALLAGLPNPDEQIPLILGLAAYISSTRRRRQQGYCAVCRKRLEGTARRAYCGPVCRSRKWRSQHVHVRVD